MSRRKRRPGEVVCRCGAYRFPHRFMGGECNGAAWVSEFWERNRWGPCRDCVLKDQREPDGCAPGYVETVCQVVDGVEDARECPELADYIRYESVRLYGVNKPPPKRAGWRR